MPILPSVSRLVQSPTDRYAATLQSNTAQMATVRTTASKPARQLGEILKEQQEPFILEVYLSERGCIRKKLTSGANFICCHGTSGKFLKRSGSQNKIKKGIPYSPMVLKVVCNKFFTIKGLRTKSSVDEDGKPSVTEMDGNSQEIAELDRFSSSSSTTVYNSCSDSDIYEPSMFADNSKSNLKLYDQREKKAAAEAKFQWSCMEDSKQHSPQSVLEETSTSTGSPLDNTRRASSTRQKSFFLPKIITEDSILSASLWNLLLQTSPEKSSYAGLRGPDWSNSSPLSISKRVLQQTKQLLFDCFRELVDNKHVKEEKGKGFLGSEEIGKVIGEKIKRWGKRCGDESNMAKLLESDIMDSIQEWNESESQKKRIVLEIGNAIAEQITNEVVMDMINVL
ncbi:uncharacterized protein LOC111314898 [Durio zibethinus]|uniref:Uncharacterized protein LOC111314898 n=1 Tax=Durio zibethinus TaxID=66656 RepID=A0A6P6B4Z8_DURZI|nr:uncharacterized protein LOC111314898 [Durio zibethinus]